MQRCIPKVQLLEISLPRPTPEDLCI